MTSNLPAMLTAEVEGLILDLEAERAARWLLDGRASPDQYAAWLEQTYHYVCWTRPLLAHAAGRLAASGGPPELVALCAEKACEESGHEQWALADLAALGRDPDAAQASPPGAAAVAYIAWNRFCVEAGAAEGILGTAFVLEAFSAQCAGRAADRLVAHSGIPGIARAVRFLRGHAVADEDHIARLGALLGGIADPRAGEAIALSARMTRAIYPLLAAPARDQPAVMGAAARGISAPPGSRPRARRTRAASAS